LINRILTVGGFTLLSRVTGFLRDIVMAAVLGAGPIADAFLVAFRLPNHFRAIFAEGAFAAAFVPAYARIRTQHGKDAAKLFGDRIFTLLLATQIVLLLLALLFTPAVIALLAPGFRNDPMRFDLAVTLTRITFPYLLLMALVTLYSGILNSVERFAAAAAAPILLNLTMVATLATAALFPTPGHAAAWGVLIAGLFEVALVGGAALRADVMTTLRKPMMDEDVKRFFKALGPATIGSAGVQLALFADTIIASFLAAGALSALYYADRLYQLPGGVIGIAVGTVLLPEMARRIAAGDENGARLAQERAIEFTLLLAIPCVAAFLIVPDLIMRALFMRGRFTAGDANAAAMTLAAYTIGLIPFVLMRSAVATFLARGDTATTVKAALTAVAVNIVFKVAFLYFTTLAQVGLALATSIGAWINFGLILWFGLRAGFMSFDAAFKRAVLKLILAGVALTGALWIAQWPVLAMTAGFPGKHNWLALLLLAFLGALVYGGVILGLFGKAWLAWFWRAPRAATPPSSVPPAPD
jgi:putative peptidoglycan lipid II flippase